MSLYLPYFLGFSLVLVFCIIFFAGLKQKGYFGEFVRWSFDGIYGFFDELIADDRLVGVKQYATIVFFLILFSNLGSLIIDIIKLGVVGIDEMIIVPTGDIHFPLMLAVLSILYMLYQQFSLKGFWTALHEYLPITGSDIIDSKIVTESGEEKTSIGAKIGDIFMSLFMGILDIVGLFAKIISLSLRLTGNIFSGGVLMWIAVAGTGLLTFKAFGVKLPILIPIILILQSLLVAFIQAFVFALLVSIFINMATTQE